MICGSLFLHRTNGFGRMVPILSINWETTPTVTERLEFQEDAIDPSVGWIPHKKILCGFLADKDTETIVRSFV